MGYFDSFGPILPCFPESLSDTETRKNFPQQVIAGELPGNRAQVFMGQPQFFGKQVKHTVIELRMLCGQLQMSGGAFQGIHMAFAGQPGRFRGWFPAGDVQQTLPQFVQPVARFGRNVQPAVSGRGLFSGQIQLVEHIQDGGACGQSLGNVAVQRVFG